MNLQPLHEKLNREHPRFSAHLTFEERDAIARTIIHSIGDVAPDAGTAPRATGSEPVAWALANKYGKIDAQTAGSREVCESRVEREGRAFFNESPFTVRPLYDHPSPSLASAPSSHIVTDSALAAILHQLEVGEASTGDVRDVAWCAKALRAYIESSLASATAGDWRESEDIRREVDLSVSQRTYFTTFNDELFRKTIEVLLDRVQSHARAASPPVPDIESREAIERGARSLWASFCLFSDSGETCPWDEVPQKERARLRLYYSFVMRAARGVSITAQTAPPVPESPSDIIERCARVCETDTITRSPRLADRIRALKESPSPVPEQTPE